MQINKLSRAGKLYLMSSTTTLEQSMSRVAMYLGSCLFHPNRSRGVSGWGDSYIIVECSLSLLTYIPVNITSAAYARSKLRTDKQQHAMCCCLQHSLSCNVQLVLGRPSPAVIAYVSNRASATVHRPAATCAPASSNNETLKDSYPFPKCKKVGNYVVPRTLTRHTRR